jgi:hypothetical protein
MEVKLLNPSTELMSILIITPFGLIPIEQITSFLEMMGESISLMMMENTGISVILLLLGNSITLQ